MKYTTVDRILAKLNREIKNAQFNEYDVIEWIGEALNFLSFQYTLVPKVLFAEVTNHTLNLPGDFSNIHQVVKSTNSNVETLEQCIKEVIPKIDPEKKAVCKCPDDFKYLQPQITLGLHFKDFTNYRFPTEYFRPIRTSTHTFFPGVNTSENIQNDLNQEDQYQNIEDKILRFSFESGFVGLSYFALPIDEESGYPLIPDEISSITAITYYVKMRFAEIEMFDHIEGSMSIYDRMQKRWEHYIGQANNNALMPKTVDDYQDLMEGNIHLVLDRTQYYDLFKNLNK